MDGLYYLCSENKGADQLCVYRTADLLLLFSHMQKTGFLMTQLILSWFENNRPRPAWYVRYSLKIVDKV